jgi:hypothetical protein
MKQIIKAIAVFFLATCTVGTLQAQKKGKKKTVTQKTTVKKKKTAAKKKTAPAKKTTAVAKTPAEKIQKTETAPKLSAESLADTTAPKVVIITSVFKPQLKTAAKLNFTAATPVIDSSRIPVSYSVPAQNLFFSYQPVPIKPLALPVDSGYTWENNSYIKLGAGNFSSYYGEAAVAFGDGKHSITNLRGNFQTTTGHLPAQQAAKWGVDVLSVFNTGNNQEWTTRPYYQSNTQYFYGYQPSTLNYSKDQLLQRYHTVGIDLGMQDKIPNDFGISYHPQVSAYRFFDNHENHENGVKIQAPLSKAFGKLYSFDLGLTADISSASFQLIPNPQVLKNNLYYINPAIVFTTPNMKIHAGMQPSWDNTVFSALPDLSAEARVSGINLILEAGWKGYFTKNSYRSLAEFNPWIGSVNSLLNTKTIEQYAGIKGAGGDHFTYQVRASLLKLNNQPLFLNSGSDGKAFAVVFEPEMKAIRLHGEVGYTEQEKLSLTAGATLTQYNGLTVNTKAWGLLPMELNGSLKWKLMKDLQVKAEVFVWDGNAYRDSTLQARKTKPAADLNLGAEFTVMPRLNLWLQMNNLLNTPYQRWNQYAVLGFNVLGGIVYSFR